MPDTQYVNTLLYRGSGTLITSYIEEKGSYNSTLCYSFIYDTVLRIGSISKLLYTVEMGIFKPRHILQTVAHQTIHSNVTNPNQTNNC